MLWLWDVSSGNELRSAALPLLEQTVVSPDGRIVASETVDHQVKLWDVADGRELRTLAGHSEDIRTISWSADGHTVGSCSKDKTAKFWDVASGRLLQP